MKISNIALYTTRKYGIQEMCLMPLKAIHDGIRKNRYAEALIMSINQNLTRKKNNLTLRPIKEIPIFHENTHDNKTN